MVRIDGGALQVKRDALRFALGAEVECKVGRREWARGVVVSHLFRTDDMPEGVVAPYQVELADGSGCIWVPQDDEDLVRSPKNKKKKHEK